MYLKYSLFVLEISPYQVDKPCITQWPLERDLWLPEDINSNSVGFIRKLHLFMCFFFSLLNMNLLMITAWYLLYAIRLYLLCCETITGLHGGTLTHSLT
jgi:hypothetical protein